LAAEVLGTMTTMSPTPTRKKSRVELDKDNAGASSQSGVATIGIDHGSSRGSGEHPNATRELLPSAREKIPQDPVMPHGNEQRNTKSDMDIDNYPTTLLLFDRHRVDHLVTLPKDHPLRHQSLFRALAKFYAESRECDGYLDLQPPQNLDRAGPDAGKPQKWAGILDWDHCSMPEGDQNYEVDVGEVSALKKMMGLLCHG
jgi:hypothetical protein